MRSLCICILVYILRKFACYLYRKPTNSRLYAYSMPIWRTRRKRPMSGHDSLPMAPDFAAKRPFNSQLCSNSVLGAWPTSHGHSWAPHPGRCRLPGQTRRPRQVFGQSHGPIRPWSPKMPAGTRNVSESPVKGPVRSYLAVDSRSLCSRTPIH